MRITSTKPEYNDTIDVIDDPNGHLFLWIQERNKDHTRKDDACLYISKDQALDLAAELTRLAGGV